MQNENFKLTITCVHWINNVIRLLFLGTIQQHFNQSIHIFAIKYKYQI